MSDVELRRFAIVAERAAGCRCRPDVTETLIVTDDGLTPVVAVIHEADCPLPPDTHPLRWVWGLP
jgi:hypothetical protein